MVGNGGAGRRISADPALRRAGSGRRVQIWRAPGPDVGGRPDRRRARALRAARTARWTMTVALPADTTAWRYGTASMTCSRVRTTRSLMCMGLLPGPLPLRVTPRNVLPGCGRQGCPALNPDTPGQAACPRGLDRLAPEGRLASGFPARTWWRVRCDDIGGELRKGSHRNRKPRQARNHLRVDREAKRQTILLPAASPPLAWYLCALPIPRSWERNAHLAAEHAPGQTWERDSLESGLGVRLQNARPIIGWSENSIPADAEMRQARLYRTCRSWQFGWWLRQHRKTPDAPPTRHKRGISRTVTPGQLSFE